MSTEALLAVGYAAFLLAAATGLDLLARHSHRRSARYRTARRPDLDMQRLPGEDGVHRLRSRSRDRSVAGSMAALGGRALPPRSLRRPRRLAALILAIALVRSDGTMDLVALSAAFGLSVAVIGRLLAAFRRTPSGSPNPADESAGAASHPFT